MRFQERTTLGRNATVNATRARRASFRLAERGAVAV
jgi:hypothetical protein